MILSLLSRKILSLHAAALILGAAGFLSRLLGLFRDRLLAGIFGAGRELDIYYAAFQIPDFVYTVLLLGAGSMAVLPIFMQAVGKGHEEAEQCISELLRFFCVVAASAIGIAIIFTPAIMARCFVGFSGDELSTAVFLTRIMFLSPLFLGLSGIFMSVTQAYQRFIAYSLSGVLYNVGIIFGIVAIVPAFGVRGLGFGVVLGALLHLAVQVVVYRRLGFSLILRGSLWSGRIWEVLYLSMPRVIAHSLWHITFAILLGFASTLSPGSIAIFQLSNNIAFLPVGIFAISYGTALFPQLSQSALNRDGERFWEGIFFGMRTILFWVTPIAFLLIVLRAHVIRVILGAGAFNWADTRLAAATVAVLAFGLIAESINTLFLRAFYSVKMTWLPLAANAIAMTGGILSAVILTRALERSGVFSERVYALFRITDLSGGEVIGVAMGFAAMSIIDVFIQGALLFVFVRRRFFPDATLMSRTAFVRPVGKIFFASGIGAFVAYSALRWFSPLFPLDAFVPVFLHGLLAGAVGIFAWGVILYSMGSEDFDAVMASFKKKLFSVDILPREWNS